MFDTQSNPDNIWAYHRGEWKTATDGDIATDNEKPLSENGWDQFLSLDDSDSSHVYSHQDGDGPFRYLILLDDIATVTSVLITDFPSLLQLLPDINRIIGLMRRSERHDRNWSARLAEAHKRNPVRSS